MSLAVEPEPVLRGMWSQALGTAVYNLDRHLPSILQHEAALVFLSLFFISISLPVQLSPSWAFWADVSRVLYLFLV